MKLRVVPDSGVLAGLLVVARKDQIPAEITQMVGFVDVACRGCGTACVEKPNNPPQLARMCLTCVSPQLANRAARGGEALISRSALNLVLALRSRSRGNA